MSNHMIDIHSGVYKDMPKRWYIFVIRNETSVMYAREYYLPHYPLMNNTNQNMISPDNYVGSLSESQLKMLQALKPDLRVGDVLDVIHKDSRE